jgi:SPX domain protein involved in polyphosphate accumulation
MRVKTMIVRHLPILVFDKSSKQQTSQRRLTLDTHVIILVLLCVSVCVCDHGKQFDESNTRNLSDSALITSVYFDNKPHDV